MQKEMDGMRDRLSRMDELETKYEQQEERCNSLQRSIQILSAENKWEYSAPPIPRSHWTDQGFDEYYIDQIENLLDDMQECTCLLRSGKCTDIALNHSIINNETDILQHDDKLLPHWMELANAIQVHPNSEQLEKLAIDNLELPTSVLNLLSPALKGKEINRCRFTHNTFDRMGDGIEFAVGLIKGLASTERFDWMNNVIEDEEHINNLIDAIISNPSIDRIQLEHSLGDGINSYDVLSTLLASEKPFTLIDLEGNNIKTEGDIAIPDFINSNPPLQHLYLANNNLNDNDALLIAQALKNNTNLLEIRLGDNNISNIGKEALYNAIYDPTSLNSLTDCNHTCCIEGISFDHRNTDNDYDEDPRRIEVRKYIIYCPLGTRRGATCST